MTPFPAGYSMGNSGAIIQATALRKAAMGPGRFFTDTLRFGLSVCGIDYYDPMDNFESSHIAQALAGGFIVIKSVVCKISYAYLQAFGVYNEQQGFFSAGTTANSICEPEYRDNWVQGGAHGRLARTCIVHIHAGMSALVFRTLCGFFAFMQQPSAEKKPQTIALILRLPYVLVCIPDLTALALRVWSVRYQKKVIIHSSFRWARSIISIIVFSLSTAFSTNPFMLYFGLIVFVVEVHGIAGICPAPRSRLVKRVDVRLGELKEKNEKKLGGF